MSILKRILALVALLLAATDLRAQPADGAILRGESPQTRKRLAEAEQKALNGKAGEAVEDLQRILDEAADDLVTLDGRHHRAARSVVHQILAKLPADALKAYQNRVEEPAHKLLQAGQRDRDVRPLQQLLDRYFVSRSSEAGLLLLGDLLFERGEYRLAEQAWRRLLPDSDDSYPNAKPDPAVKARIILAVHAQREPGRAQAELAAFEKLHAAASGALAGVTGPYVERLKSILVKPLTPSAAPDRAWPTFGGDPSRSGALRGPLPVHWPTRESWSGKLPDDLKSFPQKSPPAQPPYGHPVIQNGWAYVSDGYRVLAFELATGVQRTVFPIGNPVVDRRANDPPSSPALTAANDRIYARIGSPVLRPSEANKPGASAIVCLNPRAKPGLRDQWRLLPPAIESRAPAAWEGAPLAANGKLWCAFSRVEGGRMVYGVACYDPADTDDAPERPAWIAEVCESPLPPGSDQARGRLELLTLAGRHLVFNTNAGAVIALDSDSGHRVWAFQYPRLAKRNRGVDPSPAVHAGGRVFVAPDDSERVYGLDAETGRELWESGPVEGAQIIGVVRNRVIITTEGFAKGLRGLSVLNGSYRRPDGWIQSASLGYGQGLVSESAILWPSRDGLWFLDPDTGDPIRTAPPLRTMNAGELHLFGNLAFADGWLVVVGANDVRAYRSDEPPYVKPEEPRSRFTTLIDAEKYQEAATGDFPKPLRAWAAARLLTLSKDSPEFPELRDEWLLTADGELVTYGLLLDRKNGKPEHQKSSPGVPWSPADRKPLDVPSLTSESEVITTVRLPSGSVPLIPIRGARPPRNVFVASPGELLAVSVQEGTKTSFAIAGTFTHAADLPEGFVLAGRFAVAVYGAKREPVWIFRVPETDPVGAVAVRTESLPPAELSSFSLAGEWLFARLGDRHLIALDLKSHAIAWVLGTHGSSRYEPLMFDTMPGFTPQFFVSERLLAVQLTDGRRWLVQAATGRVKADDLPTAAVPWVSPPAALEGNLIAFSDGPGLIRFANGSKSKRLYEAEGESSLAGEPPQVRRFGEMLFATIRRNYGVELLRLDPTEAKPEWRDAAFLEAGSIDLAAADADPQRILVPSEGWLSAFNLDDGKAVWQSKLPPGRWTVRTGRTVAIAMPMEAIPDEPLGRAWSRMRDSFLRAPQPWRLPWLASALYDCWTERSVPVILFDLESGKRLKTLTIPTRGPCVLPIFEGDAALIATADRIVWLK